VGGRVHPVGAVMDHPVVERDVVDRTVMHDMRGPAGRGRRGGRCGETDDRHRDGERDQEGSDFV